MSATDAAELRLYPALGRSLAVFAGLLALEAWLVVLLSRHFGFALLAASVLFGLLALVMLVALARTGRIYLTLSPAGYCSTGLGGQTQTIPWAAIERFYVGRLPTAVARQAIFFRLSPDYLEAHPLADGILRTIGSDPMVVSGYALSPYQRALKRSEMLRLLESWRKRYSPASAT